MQKKIVLEKVEEQHCSESNLSRIGGHATLYVVLVAADRCEVIPLSYFGFP